MIPVVKIMSACPPSYKFQKLPHKQFLHGDSHSEQEVPVNVLYPLIEAVTETEEGLRTLVMKALPHSETECVDSIAAALLRENLTAAALALNVRVILTHPFIFCMGNH